MLFLNWQIRDQRSQDNLVQGVSATQSITRKKSFLLGWWLHNKALVITQILTLRKVQQRSFHGTDVSLVLAH